jgi:hypothetical protein
MKDDKTDNTVPERRFFRRFWRTKRTRGANATTTPAAGRPAEKIVITCAGCGEPTEVEVEHGRAETGNMATYFERPCPHCGREQVALTSRRYT